MVSLLASVKGTSSPCHVINLKWRNWYHIILQANFQLVKQNHAKNLKANFCAYVHNIMWFTLLKTSIHATCWKCEWRSWDVSCHPSHFRAVIIYYRLSGSFQSKCFLSYSSILCCILSGVKKMGNESDSTNFELRIFPISYRVESWRFGVAVDDASSDIIYYIYTRTVIACVNFIHNWCY